MLFIYLMIGLHKRFSYNYGISIKRLSTLKKEFVYL